MKAIFAAGAIIVLGLACSAAFAAGQHPPTSKQIAAAVKRAESSSTLWATVNVCNTRRHPDEIGIRGQMPALGFSAQLEMTVRLNYWNTVRQRFLPIPDLVRRMPLGTVTNGTVQDGVMFTFKPPVLLSGTVTFSWSRNGKVLASDVKQTTAKDKDVDDSDPRGYSAATCRISS